MRSSLAIISGILTFLCVVPYMRDMLRHRTRPNIVTWFTWALLSGIVTIAAAADGIWQVSVFAGLSTVGSLSVVLLGLKYGVKQYTWFDGVCQFVALVGVVLWRLTNDPSIAVLLVVLADLAGALPTMRHGWKHPDEETWQTFGIDGVAGALAALSVTTYTIVSAGYSLYLLVCNTVIVYIIISRRKSRAVVAE